MPKPLKIRYMHLRVSPPNGNDNTSNKDHQGAITVAFMDDEANVKFGVSFCSPRDGFCKRDGRERAMSRLLDNDPLYCAKIPKRHHMTPFTNVARTLCSIDPKVEVPQWFDILTRDDIMASIIVAAY